MSVGWCGQAAKGEDNMRFETFGERGKPAVLFFHAMGVTGASSEPVAKCLQDDHFCILPTASVYCAGQSYAGKADELRQIEQFLRAQGVDRLALVVASSIGADLAAAFLSQTKLPVDHAFFDGGQFAQIGRGTRRVMTPFLYLAIKSLYWSKGGTLKKIMWCDDDAIKPYFVAAGKALSYGDLRRQMADSLEDRPSRRCRRGCRRTAFLNSAAGRTTSSTATRSCRPIRTRISPCSRALTTCSIRSATRRASRRCCGASWNKTRCRRCRF